MKSQLANRKWPLLRLLHLGRAKGWKAGWSSTRSQDESVAGTSPADEQAAAALSTPAPPNYTAAERNYLLALARKTLESVAAHPDSPPAEVSIAEVPPKLAEKRACFVTLTKDGALRGCVGHVLPQEPLCQAVVDNTRSAALYDPRFASVESAEAADIRIEISVLTEPQRLSYTSPEDLLRQLRPPVDGVVLQIGRFSATFLPQVWAQIPDKEGFLDRLALKAGCTPSAWREPGTAVLIYHAESFEEPPSPIKS